MLKYPILFLLFFIAAIMQASLLPYILIWGAMPNLIFIIFFIVIFFEDLPLQESSHQSSEGFFLALAAGFFLDILFPSYFGVSIIALLAIYFLKKATAHFLQQTNDTYLIFYFIIMFALGFAVYQGFVYVFSLLFHIEFLVGFYISAQLFYNILVAFLGFYIYKIFLWQQGSNNQLKLL